MKARFTTPARLISSLWHPERGRLWRLTRVFACAILILSSAFLVTVHFAPVRETRDPFYTGPASPSWLAEPLVRWTGVPLDRWDLENSSAITTFARPLVPILGFVLNAYVQGFLLALLIVLITRRYREGGRILWRRLAFTACGLFVAAIILDWHYSPRTPAFYKRYSWWCWDIAREQRYLAIDSLFTVRRLERSDLLEQRIHRLREDRPDTSEAARSLTALEQSVGRWIFYDAYRNAHYRDRAIAACSLARIEGRQIIPRVARDVVKAMIMARLCGEYGTETIIFRNALTAILYEMTGVRDEWNVRVHAEPDEDRQRKVWGILEPCIPEQEFLRRLDVWLRAQNFGPLGLSTEQRYVLETTYSESIERLDSYIERHRRDDLWRHIYEGFNWHGR